MHSLTDPRAIPVEAQEFAKKLRSGGKVSSIDETLKLLDANFDYFEVPFTNGDVKNAANQNVGSAKILSFGLLARLNEEETLRMFGPLSENLSPTGTDHPNIRAFKKTGWAGVVFPTGLAILSKAQAFDDTDDGLSTQGVIVGKENSWDVNSDSWIP